MREALRNALREASREALREALMEALREALREALVIRRLLLKHLDVSYRLYRSWLTAKLLWQSNQVVNNSTFTIQVINTYTSKSVFTTACSPAVK